jgi:hypothetical protein
MVHSCSDKGEEELEELPMAFNNYYVNKKNWESPTFRYNSILKCKKIIKKQTLCFVQSKILVSCASLLVIGDQTIFPGNIRRPCGEDLTPITNHGAQL